MNKSKLVLAASLLSLSAVSFANATNTFNASNNHPGQFYISALAGIGSINIGKSDIASSQSQGGFAWQTSVGYLFGSNSPFQFGLETGFFMPADSKYTATTGVGPLNAKVSQYGVDLLGVAKVHLGQVVDLFAKAGGTLVHQEATFSYKYMGIETPTKTTVLPTVAAGVDVNLTNNVSLNLTGRYSFGKSDAFTKGKPGDVASNAAILAGITYNIA